MPDPAKNTLNARSRLRDVAQLAGVSSSTVSLVLAGKGENHRISSETQDRVQEAARTLNYAPSLLHRSVRRGKTGILSFYNSFQNRQAGDLYLDRLSAAIEHAGGRRGYNILVHCHFEPSVQKTYEFLNGGFADGLILFAPAQDDPLLARLRTSGLPTVVFSPRVPEPVLPFVGDDVEKGMDTIVQEIYRRGHRRVAIFTQSSPGWNDAQRRENLLREGLVAHGVDPEDVRTVVCGTDFESALRQAMDTPRKPTAFFVWNDRTAYDVLNACGRAGLRVPEEVSIVGYDGVVWPSDSNQRIASIHADLEGIADAAVEILDRQIEGDKGEAHRLIPGTFRPGTTLTSPPSSLSV